MRRLAITLLPILLTGCAMTPSAPPAPSTGAAIQGVVHGGQQPILGAHVYLLAANTTGYGGNGIAASSANASISLLNATSTGHSDSIGAYVLTDASGNFTITGDYTCTPNQQVYLYGLGGNPASGNNAASGLLAILGACPAAGNLSTVAPYVTVNEVTTIAAAYAFAGFATDPTHVSSSGTALAQTGIANAFANAANLVNLATGNARATTPAGNGRAPAATINTLADILAACINSNSPISTGCSTLLTSAETATSSPTDAAAAAINIAHNPAANIAAIYALVQSSPPFSPTLTSAPGDLSLGVEFTAGGLSYPEGVAIDAAGNVWITNGGGNSVTELAPSGAALSGSNGYTGSQFNKPFSIAIDTSGSAWVVNQFGNSISKLAADGTLLSGSTGFTVAGFNYPFGIAIDASGNVWVSNGQNNVIFKFSNAGTPLSGASGFPVGGSYGLGPVAIDGSGNAWVTILYSGAVAKLSPAGVSLSGSPGYVEGPSYSNVFGIAMDATGSAWLVNEGTDSIARLSNNGIILSGSAGFSSSALDPALSPVMDGAGNAWIPDYYDTHPAGIFEMSSSGALLSGPSGLTGSGTMNLGRAAAIDGSGNVWTPNYGTSTVTEIIGAATPVITPICAGLPATPTSDGSSNLGTRP